MTAHTTFAPSAIAVADADKKQHRRLVMLVSAAAIGLIAALIIYGADYYSLSQVDRPFSHKHHVLKPSGFVGINMGLLGVLMFCGIFLYPLRKRWRWLQKRGNSKHWLDYHVVLGVAAPVCIAFHSSFKFRGLAGIAFWVMVGVALSGLMGRYLYAQIPRQVVAAEMSLRVFDEVLGHQKMIPPDDLRRLLRLPAPDQVSGWPLLVALGYMVASDLARPFRIARLRAEAMGIGQAISSLGGLLPGTNTQLEWLIGLAREQALLSRRIVFLSRAEQVFRLWHVIHKPFSYAFAVLALLHIFVAMLLGFI
jgi:hypothetical protein